MKPVLVLMMCLMLGACANPNEGPQAQGPTKAEIKAREDFAKTLPKPPER
jgi:hypothetical protein